MHSRMLCQVGTPATSPAAAGGARGASGNWLDRPRYPLSPAEQCRQWAATVHNAQLILHARGEARQLGSWAGSMGAPSKYISRAANRFAASRWTHREAAVSQRENRVQMPSRLGMNWGLKPPAGQARQAGAGVGESGGPGGVGTAGRVGNSAAGVGRARRGRQHWAARNAVQVRCVAPLNAAFALHAISRRQQGRDNRRAAAVVCPATPPPRHPANPLPPCLRSSPVRPSAKLPGRMRLRLSGCQDQTSSRPYTRPRGASTSGERTRRRVTDHFGSSTICDSDSDSNKTAFLETCCLRQQQWQQQQCGQEGLPPARLNRRMQPAGRACLHSPAAAPAAHPAGVLTIAATPIAYTVLAANSWLTSVCCCVAAAAAVAAAALAAAPCAASGATAVRAARLPLPLPGEGCSPGTRPLLRGAMLGARLLGKQAQGAALMAERQVRLFMVPGSCARPCTPWI